jgi:hypothetical protein
VILGEVRTQSTHISTLPYIDVQNRSCYNLGSRFSYIEEVGSQNYTSEDKSEFVEAISLNDQNILFALKENVIHRCSKLEDPSTESNPHRFGLPTNNIHRHHLLGTSGAYKIMRRSIIEQNNDGMFIEEEHTRWHFFTRGNLLHGVVGVTRP